MVAPWLLCGIAVTASGRALRSSESRNPLPGMECNCGYVLHASLQARCLILGARLWIRPAYGLVQGARRVDGRIALGPTSAHPALTGRML